MSSWKLTDVLRHQIYKYARLPQTGVSLRQMVEFGPRPSQGSLFHASYFAVHELPIRLSHRVKELEHLPSGLSDEPSIKLVRDWYAQSFEELVSLKEPILEAEMRDFLLSDSKSDVLESDLKQGDSSNFKEHDGFVFEDDGIFIDRRKTHADRVEVKELPGITEKSADKDIIRPLGLNTYFQSAPINLIYPKEVTDYNKLVTKTLSKIKRRHDATVTTIARGVQNWKRKNKYRYLDNSINQFLDRFYMSRIGIRMLIGQTIAINQQAQGNMQDNDYVGIICLRCNIKEIAQDAIDAARFACEEHYDVLEVPKVKLYCPSDLTFMYVPGHLVHMLYETLKNSLRATIEHHRKLNPDADPDDLDYPPIKIIVAKGDEDFTVKISDEGGGIPRSAVPLVWTYFYTSADKQVNEDEFLDGLNYKVPFMGLGVGLPHSRLYARYFSGDLKMISMEGYGTDVYLHLNRLTSSSEPLQ